jgi:L-threonylcarbamoyladenylate synthase
MPTDTIYGICGSALNKKTVERIYELRKRNPAKPMIILIGSFNDLKEFGVALNEKQKKILKKFWPGKVSVVLECKNEKLIKKFKYLHPSYKFMRGIHRGTKTLAFRMPKKHQLRKILEISGPLVAPSANWEGYPPAKTISEAEKYFGNKVVYYDAGKIVGKPSKIIRLFQDGRFNMIRK